MKTLTLLLIICIFISQVKSGYYSTSLNPQDENGWNNEVNKWFSSDALTQGIVCAETEDAAFILGSTTMVNQSISTTQVIPVYHDEVTIGFTFYYSGFDNSEIIQVTIDKVNVFIFTPNDVGAQLDCDNAINTFEFTANFQHVNPSVDIEILQISEVAESTATWAINGFNLCSAYGVADGADPRCGADEWECAPEGLQEDEYFYNHQCDFTAESLLACYANHEPLEIQDDNNSLFNTSSAVDSEASDVTLSFETTELFQRVEGCFEYQVSVNGNKFVEESYYKNTLVGDNEIPGLNLTVADLPEDEAPENQKETALLTLGAQAIIDFGCPSTEDNENSQITYVCPVEFAVIGNYTIQYQENFDLSVTLSTDGFLVEDNIQFNVVNTPVNEQDQQHTFDIDSQIVICGSGAEYDLGTDGCGEIVSTFEEPFTTTKEQPISIRHEILSDFYNSFYLQISSFTLGPLDITDRIVVDSISSSQGSINFSFVPGIAGTRLEFKLTSILRSEDPYSLIRRALSTSEGEERIETTIYITFEEGEQELNVTTQKQQEEEDNSHTTIIVLISVLSTLILVSVIGGILYLRSNKNKQEKKESKYQEENQQMQTEEEFKK